MKTARWLDDADATKLCRALVDAARADGGAPITTYGGGVVVRHEGRVVGAIAVSGRAPEDDHRLADGARRAFAAAFSAAC